MAYTHNGVNVKSIIHNGAQVKKWMHNGVLVYESASPWRPYELLDTQLVANSPAAIPVSTGVVTAITSTYMWSTSSAANQYMEISTSNVDGSKFLPTRGCKYLDIVVSCDWPKVNTAEVYALVNGVETLIHTQEIPEVNSNTNNYIDGVQVNQYVYNWTNISVEGYDKIKVVHKGTGSNNRGVTLGIGVANFHN